MFVAELFEAKIQKTLVIMPGGFHPWTPGHMALYQSAVNAFPEADVYVASTNDTSERPIPFETKKELASIAGVPADHFVQVKSPFRAQEITQHYDPDTTTLIFVRSEKDRAEPPHAGGTKKNGEPAYLQPITKHLSPMNQHGYMAYLPVAKFAGGMTSATEIRRAWARATPAGRAKIAQTLYPANPEHALKLLSVLGEQAVAEAGGVGAIAQQSQKNDPRYSMSLTQDVRPGEIDRNLKKLHLESDSPAADVMMHLIQKYRDDIDYYQELVADPKINSKAKPYYQKKIAELREKIRNVYKG
jgi:hypothetical protein